MDKDKVLLTKSGVEKLEEERDNLINVERPRAVSYTHLDVYKRQIWRKKKNYERFFC